MKKLFGNKDKVNYEKKYTNLLKNVQKYEEQYKKQEDVVKEMVTAQTERDIKHMREKEQTSKNLRNKNEEIRKQKEEIRKQKEDLERYKTERDDYYNYMLTFKNKLKDLHGSNLGNILEALNNTQKKLSNTRVKYEELKKLSNESQIQIENYLPNYLNKLTKYVLYPGFVTSSIDDYQNLMKSLIKLINFIIISNREYVHEYMKYYYDIFKSIGVPTKEQVVNLTNGQIWIPVESWTESLGRITKFFSSAILPKLNFIIKNLIYLISKIYYLTENNDNHERNIIEEWDLIFLFSIIHNLVIPIRKNTVFDITNFFNLLKINIKVTEKGEYKYIHLLFYETFRPYLFYLCKHLAPYHSTLQLIIQQRLLYYLSIYRNGSVNELWTQNMIEFLQALKLLTWEQQMKVITNKDICFGNWMYNNEVVNVPRCFGWCDDNEMQQIKDFLIKFINREIHWQHNNTIELNNINWERIEPSNIQNTASSNSEIEEQPVILSNLNNIYNAFQQKYRNVDIGNETSNGMDKSIYFQKDQSGNVSQIIITTKFLDSIDHDDNSRKDFIQVFHINPISVYRILTSINSKYTYIVLRIINNQLMVGIWNFWGWGSYPLCYRPPSTNNAIDKDGCGLLEWGNGSKWITVEDFNELHPSHELLTSSIKMNVLKTPWSHEMPYVNVKREISNINRKKINYSTRRRMSQNGSR